MPLAGITFAVPLSPALSPDISGELAQDDEPSAKRTKEMGP